MKLELWKQDHPPKEFHPLIGAELPVSTRPPTMGESSDNFLDCDQSINLAQWTTNEAVIGAIMAENRSLLALHNHSSMPERDSWSEGQRWEAESAPFHLSLLPYNDSAYKRSNWPGNVLNYRHSQHFHKAISVDLQLAGKRADRCANNLPIKLHASSLNPFARTCLNQYRSRIYFGEYNYFPFYRNVDNCLEMKTNLKKRNKLANIQDALNGKKRRRMSTSFTTFLLLKRTTISVSEVDTPARFVMSVGAMSWPQPTNEWRPIFSPLLAIISRRRSCRAFYFNARLSNFFHFFFRRHWFNDTRCHCPNCSVISVWILSVSSSRSAVKFASGQHWIATFNLSISRHFVAVIQRWQHYQIKSLRLLQNVQNYCSKL